MKSIAINLQRLANIHIKYAARWIHIYYSTPFSTHDPVINQHGVPGTIESCLQFNLNHILNQRAIVPNHLPQTFTHPQWIKQLILTKPPILHYQQHYYYVYKLYTQEQRTSLTSITLLSSCNPILLIFYWKTCHLQVLTHLTYYYYYYYLCQLLLLSILLYFFARIINIVQNF